MAPSARRQSERLALRLNELAAAAERSRESQFAAIARGIAPWSSVPAGYVRPRAADGSALPYVVDPTLAPVVREAFEMRANGARVADIRAHLARYGVALSPHGTQTLLRQRAYVGELHFGDYPPNLSAWEPIIDRDTFERVQSRKTPRGPRGSSDRLLARLGVLRCSACNGRMTVVATTSRNGSRFYSYRCPAVREDCSQRAAISAEMIERHVVEMALARVFEIQGHGSVETDVRAAEVALEVAQAELDAAIRTLTVVGDEPAAVERLTTLQAVRNAARERVDQLAATARGALTLHAASDWPRLSSAARREIIRLTVASVTVAPGRGLDRVALRFVGE